MKKLAILLGGLVLVACGQSRPEDQPAPLVLEQQSLSDFLGIDPLCILSPNSNAPYAKFEPTAAYVNSLYPPTYPNTNVHAYGSSTDWVKVRLVVPFGLYSNWSSNTFQGSTLNNLMISPNYGTAKGTYYVDMYYTTNQNSHECKAQSLAVYVQ